MPEPILDWGIALVLRLQGMGDWLVVPMNALTVTGDVAFFGMAAGASWLYIRGNFDAGGLLQYRLLRYLVGVLGVAIFYAGLDAIFVLVAEDESVLGYVLRYVRYGLVGFWMMGLAPVLFIWLGWARTENRDGYRRYSPK